MEVILHNYNSQMRSVLFWHHKQNKNIFINSGTRQQCNLVTCDVTSDLVCYVLTRWRAKCRLQIVAKVAYLRLICMIIDYLWILFISEFLSRDVMHKCGLCRHAVSVTFVDHVKTNKHIFKKFSPSGSHTILVFLFQTPWQYSDGNPPNGGIECKWGRQKSLFWAYISLDCLC